MNDLESLFTTRAIVEHDILTLPLWNGDGWLQSWAHKHFLNGSWMEGDDRLGYLPVTKETQLQSDVERMFRDTGPRIHLGTYGVAFITFEKAAHRVDLLVTQSGWNVGADHIFRLTGEHVSELHPKDRPTTSYPVWRMDFSVYTPQTILELPYIPDLVVEKESFPKALW